MTRLSKVALLLTMSAALALMVGDLFAKPGGSPGKVDASTVSTAPSPTGAGDGASKRKGGTICGHGCSAHPRPGYTQPPCRGGHMGPNGVMIQCQ